MRVESAPSVAVIVLNFNGRRWLDACFAALALTDHPNFWTILVDNGSTDGSVEQVEGRYAAVEVIRNGANLGFCEGNNRGIRRALEKEADYIVLLNPDTRIERDCLRRLVEAGESERGLGIIGAVQLEYEGDGFNSWTRAALKAHLDELKEPERARLSIAVDWVEGACLAVKREVFDRVGLLDPIYFAFYEEIDLCRRAALGGWGVAVAPRARVHHFRGGSWEADARRKRERDYRCDRSQFIYTLTEPRRSLAANIGWYLVTLGTKGKEALGEMSAARLWDLARMQVSLLGEVGAMISKWRRDRDAHQAPR